jgi:DNA-binding beta-propeller fold protein YncE
LSLGLLLTAPAAAPTVLRSLKVGGEGGWDYPNLDPDHGRLYIPRATRVMVLDLDGKAVGEVPGTPGVHGVALCQDLDRGWTSNGHADTVTVFKLSTLEVVQVIATTGGNPDAILFEPATRRVFTFNGRGRNATVIDAASSQVLATIPLGGKPEFAACDGKGRVYLNDEDNARLLAIDARSLKQVASWPLKPLERPTGLAMDPEHNRLFAVAGNRLAAVVDAGSGRILATLPIGARTDGVAFDPGSGCAYASNGEGTLTVIRPTGPVSYAASTVPTRAGARTIVANPSTGRLYLPTADFLPVPAGAAPGTRPQLAPGSFQILEVGQP